MADYKEVTIRITPFSTDAADLLAAILADADFESFVQDEDSLKAYIPADVFDPRKLSEALEGFPMQVRFKTKVDHIEGRDWNSEWEKNYFKPIVIGDKCVVHSSFHTDIPAARYDIVIEPRMAFGTGHHSTTALIMGYLLDMDLEGKKVIDMGTGTGILAILCMMRGASQAVGVEIDKDAYDNACDNVALNGVSVHLIHGDASTIVSGGLEHTADLLIANINRNIILADIDRYSEALSGVKGEMILSGFYEADTTLIERRAAMLGFRIAESRTDAGWCALRLVRKD